MEGKEGQIRGGKEEEKMRGKMRMGREEREEQEGKVKEMKEKEG